MKASSFYATALTAEMITEPTTAVIESVEARAYQNRKKITLTFRDLPAALVLNKTNAMRMIEAFGDDTDAWIGREIVITVEQVEFKGRNVPGLRVSPRK